MESARDHSYLIERLLIFAGFIFPTVGYFVSRAVDPSQVGKYYTAFNNLQTIWLGGAYLALLHSSNSSIWTLRWCLCIVFCVVGFSLSSMFLSMDLSIEVLCYFFMSAAAIIFFHLFRKTIISVRRKDSNGKMQSMSSADYFCIMYCTLTSFNFIIQLVVNSIVYSMYGYEIAIIYTNITAILCITLANMVPNRREEDVKIKLEFTEKSLAIKQAFVRYLSHEMHPP
eukprot:gene37572-50720_t